MTFMEAALCEPVSVAIAACKRAELKVGQRVLIMGAGPIGLLTAMVANTYGASTITMADISIDRLDFARKNLCGEIQFHLIDTQKSSKENAKLLKIRDKGNMPDITFECSGAESAVQTAVYATKSGGKVMLVGIGGPMTNVPVIEALCREVEIRGMFRYSNW